MLNFAHDYFSSGAKNAKTVSVMSATDLIAIYAAVGTALHALGQKTSSGIFSGAKSAPLPFFLTRISKFKSFSAFGRPHIAKRR